MEQQKARLQCAMAKTKSVHSREMLPSTAILRLMAHGIVIISVLGICCLKSSQALPDVIRIGKVDYYLSFCIDPLYCHPFLTHSLY